ncbi:hypothetical protein TASIC1_0006003000 [Trichoderma asperellum]|uniref:Uncharacterized protein n=1 Tax=Trichoderma asperellum TaxID=101201 RepID=A0A6V8QU26_TRIAP|nr:hypothetical protein TASIC1_0006003000 [Trichoderma asperellum]
MTPKLKLKTKAACSESYLFTPSHYTLMSEPAAAVEEKQTDRPAPASVVTSGPGLASSSCVVTVSPSSTAFHGASRPDRSPPSQLPSVDPCLIVMRPRVQQEPPHKAGASTCARLISGLGPFLDIERGERLKTGGKPRISANSAVVLGSSSHAGCASKGLYSGLSAKERYYAAIQ